jgi:PAS domain S-box-containing protein
MVMPHKDPSADVRWWSGLPAYVGALVLWCLLANLGSRYLLPPAHVTLIWLASGITVGLLLITPQNRRGVLLAIVCVLHAATNALWGHTPVGAVLIALAYTLDALVVVFVYERLMAGHDRSFTSVRSVLTFSLAAAVGAPAVFGVFGALTCAFAYGKIDIGETWFIWSVTDSLGLMIFAPFVVVWSDWRPAELRSVGWRPASIAVLAFLLLTVVLEVLIGSHIPVPLPVFSRAYLTFPLLFVWTYKYGMRGVTIGVLPMAAVMLWNALDGPWSVIWPSAIFPRVVTVQLFLVVLSMSGLAFAALLKERAATLDRLRTSADHQRELARRLEVQVERIPLGLVVLDRSGIIREWNPSAEIIFGLSARDAIGQILADRVIPHDRRHLFSRLQDEAMKGDRSVRAVTPALRHDSAPLQIEWNATPLRGEGGVLSGILATAQDVTDRTRSEKKIQRLNRLYAFLSQINQAIVRSRSREELFGSICSVAVHHGKFRFAWIGELKPDAQVIEPVASAGEGEPYLSAMRQTPVHGPHARRTPMASAIMSQQVEIVQRLTADPRMAAWYDQIRASGLASSVSLPLTVSGIFNGCLDVYAAEADHFDTEEMDVLHEIRGDILFALGSLAMDGRQRSTEQALHVSENRFRTIVESIDDLVFTLDREQRHTGVYGRALARGGLTPEFFLHRTSREILGPEAAAIHEHYNARALEGEVIQYEWETGEGENRQVFSTSLAPRVDEHGAIIGVTGVARDVTGRKRMEEDLRASRELFSALFHLSPVPTTLSNMKTFTFVDVNKAFEEWSGYSREELAGRSPVEFNVFEDLDRRAHILKELEDKGSVSRAGIGVRLRSGALRQVELYAGVISLGDECYLISKALDVTDRRKVEEALAEERAMLARRVDERTAELVLANDALARAARLKDEFLASMSHELRTPLTGILGMSEALQMQVYGSLNERQSRSVRTIAESGQHLLSLINDILDLSRIEAGKMELQMDIVVVSSMIQSVSEMVRRAAESKHLTLSILHDDRVRTMRADPRRLKQVLANILSNAVKFTPDGGSVTVTVKGDPEHARVAFLCTDTGIGIAKADLPRLFQPFVQLDSRLSREYAGSGLGLSLVQRIVELHGGSVQVESEPGRGSVFTIILPWHTDPSIPAEPYAESSTKPRVPTLPDQRRPLLLIADDNETTLALYADYFQDCGYDTVLATNGAEAVRCTDDARPSAILMDVQMPGVDGLTATRTIREAEKGGGRMRVPIIALTALTMPGDRERCLDAGADAYVSKPVDLKALEQKVRDLVTGAGRV